MTDDIFPSHRQPKVRAPFDVPVTVTVVGHALVWTRHDPCCDWVRAETPDGQILDYMGAAARILKDRVGVGGTATVVRRRGRRSLEVLNGR